MSKARTFLGYNMKGAGVCRPFYYGYNISPFVLRIRGMEREVMAIELTGLSLPLDSGDAEIREAAAAKLRVRTEDIALLRVKRQSLDSRRRGIHFVYTVHVALCDALRQQRLEKEFGAAEEYAPLEIQYGRERCGQPVVVGAGPCGLFAALTLAQHGYRPLLLERGRGIEARGRDVEALQVSGNLDPESNVCFGAGGAGAWSDGKLTTRIKDPRAESVLRTLAECGAPREILTLAKPHTGTEHIRTAVEGIVKSIRALGGQVEYESRLTRIAVTDGALRGIWYRKHGLETRVETRAAVLAIGHSARDTWEALLGGGAVLLPKPFAVGVRIEHPRERIDRAQYGAAFGHPRLGAAEYALKARHGARGVYSFCMCPGGEVICSATEPGGLAVNGMSWYARDGENSNSAVVVSVGMDDFEPGPLGGMRFAQRWERAAYREGLFAPAQTQGDFLAGRVSKKFGAVRPTYRPGVLPADLRECLPEFVSEGIAAGLRDFGTKLRDFDMPDAVLTGVETRTSSPLRTPRGENLQAEGIAGLYPAGEGAGYAGGIVSAAVDGMRCAEALMRRCARE